MSFIKKFNNLLHMEKQACLAYGLTMFPNEKAIKIYYAHHQYKYHTKVEEYELRLIRSHFPNATIFNPSMDLPIFDLKTESKIMESCLREVGKSDVVVFSSMDGVIGVGVFKELHTAGILAKPTYYIYQDRLCSNFEVNVNSRSDATDRTYAFVNLKEE